MGADDLLTISPACFVASMDLVIIMIAVGSYVGDRMEQNSPQIT